MRHLGVDEWVNMTASALAAAACAAFAVIYHVRAAWWRSEVGRNLMSFAAAVCALCVYTVLATIWQGDKCVLMALRSARTLVLLAVAALMVQRTRLLLKAQREHRNRTGV
ncbi:putative phage holin [Streptomyces longwoodensis]|uniref:putative phage holin n=1 Tax=Streptomyces longwoodensis TaxID=68231 RepID=UPI0037F9498D